MERLCGLREEGLHLGSHTGYAEAAGPNPQQVRNRTRVWRELHPVGACGSESLQLHRNTLHLYSLQFCASLPQIPLYPNQPEQFSDFSSQTVLD